MYASSLHYLVLCTGVAAALIGRSSCGGGDGCSQDDMERTSSSYYYMIGATIAALILPLFATILSYFVMKLLILFGEDAVEKKKMTSRNDTDGMELVELPADVVMQGDSSKKTVLAEFHNYAIADVEQANFHSLKLTAAVMLFFAFLFIMLALTGGE